jgi:hypothetical protein
VVETHDLPSARQTYGSVARLLLEQLDSLEEEAVEPPDEGYRSIPVFSASVEGPIESRRTETGTAYFDVNGRYLGTVTPVGKVVYEESVTE